jgi:uncharacterized protein (TIGR00304 family)
MLEKLNLEFFITLGVVLVVIGIIFVISAVILASSRRSEGGKTKAAGVIMIGPIPIIFGTDKKSVKSVLVLALALTITLIVAMFLYYYLMLR